MRVQLREMGPSLDFVVRRHLWGDPALLKAAHARPKVYSRVPYPHPEIRLFAAVPAWSVALTK